MNEPKVLVREQGARRSPPLAPAAEFGWDMLGWIGVVFLLVGGLDIALAWFPSQFGSPEWEFGTVSATLDALPLPTMGLLFVLVACIARGSRAGIRVACIVLWVVAALIVGAALLYATNIPIALKSVPNPVALTGLKKAIAKSIGQGVLYPIALISIGWKGWRHTAPHVARQGA